MGPQDSVAKLIATQGLYFLCCCIQDRKKILFETTTAMSILQFNINLLQDLVSFLYVCKYVRLLSQHGRQNNRLKLMFKQNCLLLLRCLDYAAVFE